MSGGTEGFEGVKAAIAEHLPPAREGGFDDHTEALFICGAAGEHFGPDVFALDKAKEREKLRELERAARALREAYLSLDVRVRGALQDGMRHADWRDVGMRPVPSPSTLLALPPLLEAGLPQAREAIGAAVDKGKRRTRDVAVVSAARALWRKRMGEDPPARGVNETSPFGVFLADVLAALGGGSVRGAFRAWRALQVHTSGEESL